MPIRNGDGSKYASFIEGVDNTTAIDSKEVAGTISVGDNTDLVDDFLAKKRGGYGLITTWGTRNFRGSLEYKNVNGTVEELVYAEDAALTGFSGIWGKFTGTATPSTIVSNLRDGIKPSIFQFRSLAFLFNGRENLIYDGNTSRQMGIDGPTVAPTFVTNIAGELVETGSYIFAYSYYNSATGAESNLSPASESMISGTAAGNDQGIRIAVTAGSSSTADKIRIYRSVSGGDIFFRETEIVISSPSYDSITSDDGLGSEAELDNSRLTEPAAFGIVHDNRIFCGGFKSNPNRIQHSKIGISGPMPESFQTLDIVDANINDGDVLLGFGKAGSNVIAIKERSVGRLIRIDSSLGGLEREGSAKYIYDEISNEVTGLSHHLIVSLDNIVIWFGRDDIYGTDGSQIFRFGKRVRKTIKALDFSLAHKWSCINKTDTQQILFAVTPTGKTECDYQFVGHYRNFPKIAFTFYTAGPSTTTHPGLVVGTFVQVTLNKVKKFYFGSASGTGKVYQMDVGDNDETLGIYWDFRLPWDGKGNPNAKKHFHSYYVLAAGSGSSPNNVLTQTWEENTDESVVLTASKALPSSKFTWSGGTWNTLEWSRVKFGPIKFHPRRKAYLGRYGVNNTFADQPIAIRALTGITQPVPIH